ncbi:MAG: FAD-binding oxidoreductase [Saprospiraceae bacterium]|nr:FAD-binding oxidoreductase [Saprospiraceae bacterium]
MGDDMMFDYAIVGQGLAGTLLARCLIAENMKVIIIDDHFNGSASRVAAGIVNPITGKYFVPSWRIHEFLPVAKEMYDVISIELGVKTYTETNIVRVLDSIEDENNWIGRTADPTLSDFIEPDVDLTSFTGKVRASSFGYGELKGAFQVHLPVILDGYRKKWLDLGIYLEEKFVYDQLIISGDTYAYQNKKFSNIVFCEGYQAKFNPFFQNIKLAPSKGEVLIVKIPEARFKKMYKDKVFFVNLYDDVFWVGSGYEWNCKDDKGTANGYIALEKELKRVLNISYEILEHKAAIRPTMHTRRPILMPHEQYINMFIFNGLGTKGSSIGPFFAKQFTKYLMERNPADLTLF